MKLQKLNDEDKMKKNEAEDRRNRNVSIASLSRYNDDACRVEIPPEQNVALTYWPLPSSNMQAELITHKSRPVHVRARVLYACVCVCVSYENDAIDERCTRS